jgi:hypothetical protein
MTVKMRKAVVVQVVRLHHPRLATAGLSRADIQGNKDMASNRVDIQGNTDMVSNRVDIPHSSSKAMVNSRATMECLLHSKVSILLNKAATELHHLLQGTSLFSQ